MTMILNFARAGGALALSLGFCGGPILPAQALTFNLLHTFTGPPDGIQPFDGLYQDSNGNLFGTASSGGDANCPNGGDGGCGIVFELGKNGQYQVLYSFQGGDDGDYPTAGVTGDGTGNLYGATQGFNGATGTLFKLSQAGQETVLFRFSSFADGSAPSTTPVLDAAGNVFGTTEYGGDASCGSHQSGCGVIYEMTAGGKFRTLYTFASAAEAQPTTGVVNDAKGSLYGSTEFGGDMNCYYGFGCGSIFKLDKTGKFTVLHRFGKFKDGWFPGAVTLDAAGNLYGTTIGGGYRNCVPSNRDNSGCGTIFKIDTAGQFSTLFTFTPEIIINPDYNALSLDSQGNIYGSQVHGGANNNGFVFELDTNGNFTDLMDFPPYSNDSGFFANSVIRDKGGNFYGMMQDGGEVDCGAARNGCGTVFSLTP
jgi:uncharacterized repeat protein (TIGR03803 family)